MNIKSTIVLIATVLFSILFIAAGFYMFKDYQVDSGEDYAAYKAKVTSVDKFDEALDHYNNIVKTIYFSAGITHGPEKNTIVTCTQEVGGMMAMQDREIETGDSILVVYVSDLGTGEPGWMFGGYNRVDALIILCASFLAFIVVLGHMKGVTTILSLIFSCLAIFLVYVPSILSGFPVYVSTVIVALFIILMSLLLINGANQKTLCAVLGNIGGVIVAAVAVLIMNNVMKMSGFIDDDYMLLSMIDPHKPLDLLAIVWGGMVLGSVGAIMDVAMSIASAMHELADHMSMKSFSKMFRSGMNIGRDAIGTMTNTLILAYIGSSLALVLLLVVYSKDTLTLFSMEMIAAQVVQAVAGSMGILFAVPITALFSAHIYSKQVR